MLTIKIVLFIVIIFFLNNNQYILLFYIRHENNNINHLNDIMTTPLSLSPQVKKKYIIPAYLVRPSKYFTPHFFPLELVCSPKEVWLK